MVTHQTDEATVKLLTREQGCMHLHPSAQKHFWKLSQT